MQVAVAARSKAWTVFASSDAGIVGSNSTQGMDVCMRLVCVCVVLCVGSGLATDWSRLRSATDCVEIKKTEKAAKVQRTVEPYRENDRKK
jgi:hypothetical protein